MKRISVVQQVAIRTGNRRTGVDYFNAFLRFIWSSPVPTLASVDFSVIARGNGPRIAVLAFLALILLACTPQSPYPRILLSDLEPVARVSRTDGDALKVALATGLSPSQSIARYQAITDYLSSQLGRRVELVQRKTYAEVDSLLREGMVDIAFVCSSSYVIAQEAFGERLLAVPVIRNTPYYQSVIIVNESSSITSFSQLRGRSFALVDPQSTSGALYLLSKVAHLGGLAYFKSHIFTYSHDYSIAAVRDGLVTGACVDSNALAAALAKDSKLGNSIKVIDISPTYANNPVVASPKLDERVFEKVQRFLLAMDSDPEGRLALNLAGIERFVLLDDREYDSVRQLVQKARVKR